MWLNNTQIEVEGNANFKIQLILTLRIHIGRDRKQDYIATVVD